MQAPDQEAFVSLPISTIELLCDAIQNAGTGAAFMDPIDHARMDWLGAGLLTINLNATQPGMHADALELRRIWSSDTSAYPVGGQKRKAMTAWTRTLFLRREIFKAEGEAAMRDTFDDYATMAALGLQCALNVPIVREQTCVGVFNFLSPLPRWTKPQIAATRLLAMLAKPWILQEAAREQHRWSAA